MILKEITLLKYQEELYGEDDERVFMENIFN